MCVCMYISIYLSISLSLYIYIYTYIYIYIYIYTEIWRGSRCQHSQEGIRNRAKPNRPNRTGRTEPNRLIPAPAGTGRGTEPNRTGRSHDAYEKHRPNRIEPGNYSFRTEWNRTGEFSKSPEPNRTEPVPSYILSLLRSPALSKSQLPSTLRIHCATYCCHSITQFYCTLLLPSVIASPPAIPI